MSAPTPAQARVLTAIRDHLRRTGTSPSYSEILAATGLKSKSAVCRHVRQLIARGLLVRFANGPRSLSPVAMQTPLEQKLIEAAERTVSAIDEWQIARATGCADTEHQKAKAVVAARTDLRLVLAGAEDQP